jgi:hypothetical protein
MADDALTISLTGPLADDVRAAAEARGLSPEEFVRQRLETDLEADAIGDDLDWKEDERRLAEPGDDVPMEEVFDKLRQRVADLRAAKK